MEKNTILSEVFPGLHQYFQEITLTDIKKDNIDSFYQEKLKQLSYEVPPLEKPLSHQRPPIQEEKAQKSLSLKEHFSSLQGCSSCSKKCLEPDANVCFLPFIHPSPRKNFVLFLGDTPREKGENGYALLSSPQTELVHKIASSLRLAPDQYTLSSLIKCPGTGESEEERYQNCLTHFQDELKLFRPRLIITMGAKTLRMLTQNTTPLFEIHGELCSPPEHLKHLPWPKNTHIFPLFHPEFLLLNPSLKRKAWEDLQKVFSFLQ